MRDVPCGGCACVFYRLPLEYLQYLPTSLLQILSAKIGSLFLNKYSTYIIAKQGFNPDRPARRLEVRYVLSKTQKLFIRMQHNGTRESLHTTLGPLVPNTPQRRTPRGVRTLSFLTSFRRQPWKRTKPNLCRHRHSMNKLQLHTLDTIRHGCDFIKI